MGDLSVTPTEVLQVTGHSRATDGTAGETIAAGKVVAVDSDKSIKLCDANATNTYLNTIAGIALNGAASGQPIKYEKGDQITIGTTAAPTVGKVYLGSLTAGGITPAGDSTNTGRVNVVGVGMTAGKLKLILTDSGVDGAI